MAAIATPVTSWKPAASGGFSGAEVWCGHDSGGQPRLALKNWPVAMPFDRLAGIHAWMQQAAACPFVAQPLRNDSGGTIHLESGRAWDLTPWMPGEPISPVPTPTRIEAACAALATLHRIWKPNVPRYEPIPGIFRRLHILADWETNRDRLMSICHASLRRGLLATVRLVEPARISLRSWLARPVPVQPCLCDVHRDHILFADDRVSGIIDYGAMKYDHVAVDLARYLGDCVGDDDALFERGLIAYGDPELPSNLVRLLDRSGVICAMIGWGFRVRADSSLSRAALARIERLTERLEGFRDV